MSQEEMEEIDFMVEDDNMPTDKKEVLIIGDTSKEQQMITMIAQAASNPDVDVDKMQKLIDMNIGMMDKQAEIDFNQAMARMQPQLPQIHKGAKGHNSKYATYEAIDKAVRPFYTKEGFSVSFNVKKTGDNEETYYGKLRHASGYSETSEMVLPADGSGSKNAIQAKGSTISYAKRYLLCMLLNIVTTSEDDDAQSAFPLDDIQLDHIRTLIDETGSDTAKLCTFANAKSLPEIQQSRYKELVTTLIAKKKEAKK